jgi:dienelactone hydrolase
METTMGGISQMRIFAIVVFAVLGAGMALAPGYGQESAEKLAGDVANDLANHRLAEVVARFSPELAKALPLPVLDKVWSGILQQGGPVREVAPARLVEVTSAGVTPVIVPISLERIKLDIKVGIANGQVVGLLIAPSAAPAQTWNAPAYVDAVKFSNVEVTVGMAPAALGGTLSLPKTADKVPAVVLIHGSGPNDRDETLGPSRPFRDIAEGLASRGVAALRYDKRTKVYPEQFARSFTVREETMDDALAAVALLAKRAEIDAGRIVIVGHSLGGMLAPRIAEGGTGVAAVVIMAGSTRPLPMIMVEQSEYIATLDGPADETVKTRIDAIKTEAARAMAAKASDVGPMILGAPAAYWADLNTYDPAATAAKLSLPLLILQGGRDYQVTAADLQRFKTALAGHPNVTIRESSVHVRRRQEPAGGVSKARARRCRRHRDFGGVRYEAAEMMAPPAGAAAPIPNLPEPVSFQRVRCRCFQHAAVQRGDKTERTT